MNNKSIWSSVFASGLLFTVGCGETVRQSDREPMKPLDGYRTIYRNDFSAVDSLSGWGENMALGVDPSGEPVGVFRVNPGSAHNDLGMVNRYSRTTSEGDNNRLTYKIDFMIPEIIAGQFYVGVEGGPQRNNNYRRLLINVLRDTFRFHVGRGLEGENRFAYVDIDLSMEPGTWYRAEFYFGSEEEGVNCRLYPRDGERPEEPTLALTPEKVADLKIGEWDAFEPAVANPRLVMVLDRSEVFVDNVEVLAMENKTVENQVPVLIPQSIDRDFGGIGLLIGDDADMCKIAEKGTDTDKYWGPDYCEGSDYCEFYEFSSLDDLGSAVIGSSDYPATEGDTVCMRFSVYDVDGDWMHFRPGKRRDGETPHTGELSTESGGMFFSVFRFVRHNVESGTFTLDMSYDDDRGLGDGTAVTFDIP